MRTLRLALAQINPTVGDLRGNALAVRSWLAKAEAAGADLVAFPELTLTGYPPEDLLLKRSFVDENLAVLARLAKDVGDAAAIVGFVDRDDGGLYNAAALLARGKVRGVYRKVRLPNYGVFDEKRYFVAGSAFPLFRVRGVQIGISICEDAWAGDGPVRSLARAGAEVVVNVNASPYHRGKGLERTILFRQRARDNGIFFAYLQTVGGQDELIFDGETLVFDPNGHLLARGAQFAEDLVVCDLSLPAAPRKTASKAPVTDVSKPLARSRKRPAVPPRSIPEPMGPEEEVYAALTLGVRDYLRKNGFAQAVIGLSGGIDSSLVAAIAADAIGAGNVLGVSMPSRVTSTASIEDAKELASNLGIGFRVVPIDALVTGYEASLLDALGEPLPGAALDNVQARIRGTLLMGISNATGAIVLTTGNKSEMATGYATLYGDMAGGFAVIKDVPKTLVYTLCRWRNERGPAAIPESVIVKPPTAELHEGQLDTDSLPPYDELDPILEAYVERDAGLDEIAKAGFDEPTVGRVARMVDTAEYKRRQAPPGIKITARAFGRDRRLPITNGYREWAMKIPGRKPGRGKDPR
ncbi:MAG TPA: NAD+ synthase [Actinomycetota bacterium]|nr:NAD+ synthase [Actinomycetota bacterium]